MRKFIALSAGSAMCIVMGMLSGVAASAADAPTIEVTLQNGAFSPAEVKVAANTAVVLKFINKDAAAAEIEAQNLSRRLRLAGTGDELDRLSETLNTMLGRLEASGSFNAMFTHRVKVSDVKEVDLELIGWLRRAYEEA